MMATSYVFSGQLPRRQFGNLQRQIDDLPADVVWDTIPNAIRPGPAVSQRLDPTFNVAVIPTIKR
jgi:hypothetical protein